MKATEKELRALRQFVSKDQTRANISVLWAYQSDDGLTYVATDGHTIAIRRSGSHRKMVLANISKLAPCAVTEVGLVPNPNGDPPAWWAVVHAGADGPIAKGYGIDTHYMARVGGVESAVASRNVADYQPKGTKHDQKLAKERLKNVAARWTIPSNNDAGWYWTLESDAARWEGVIMPRRI